MHLIAALDAKKAKKPIVRRKIMLRCGSSTAARSDCSGNLDAGTTLSLTQAGTRNPLKASQSALGLFCAGWEKPFSFSEKASHRPGGRV
jgi:hypothetical protein